MPTKIAVRTFMFIFFMFFAVSSLAFDGNRKGFILGFGSGPALTSFVQTFKYSQVIVEYNSDERTLDRETNFGLGTDFRIGYAFSERLQLYYVNKLTWFSIGNALTENVTVANGIGGVGLTYYLSNGFKAPYLSCGFPLASWMLPFEENADISSGLGIAIGAGYEFARHWSVEAQLLYGSPNKETLVGPLRIKEKATANALGFVVQLNCLAY